MRCATRMLPNIIKCSVNIAIYISKRYLFTLVQTVNKQRKSVMLYFWATPQILFLFVVVMKY